MATAAEVLVQCLVEHGVDRVFCVPGESYLTVLDALRDSSVDTVVARQEGGAAMMAEADGKMTGRAGICFVTRGPGATNASSGVHVAEQDSTPLVVFVGQVATDMRGRGAFQEIDYRGFYGGIAKAVFEIEDPAETASVVTEALAIAESGRPGPVVVAIPENVQEPTVSGVPATQSPRGAGVEPGEVAKLRELLDAAERPVVIAGGSGWTVEGVADLHAFAEAWDLPVSVVFRRQQLFNHDHPNYAGDCGIGVNPNLRARIEGSDLVLVLGSRFSEIPSQGYTLLEAAQTGQTLVHVHVSETNRFPHADLTIEAHPEAIIPNIGTPTSNRDRGAAAANADYVAWGGQPPVIPGDLQMGLVMQQLRSIVSDDAVITNGAGNYSTWVHRYFPFRGYGTQLAPTSGSMGYGLPAAVAAKIRHPDREVICFAGDGCFQMTGQEFGTAVQRGANIIVIVVDNGMYGTIRMHQERRFPERVHATDIVNPDFAALARAYGGWGATVSRTDEFAYALEEARAADLPAILHLLVDPSAITPTTTIDELRGL